jgi:far upstream element-binding protein
MCGCRRTRVSRGRRRDSGSCCGIVSFAHLPSRFVFWSSSAVGLVIGRGGETIKQIQSMTGVYVQVHKENPGGENRPGLRLITLKGSEQSIAAGEVEVMRIVNGADQGGYGGGGGMGRPGGFSGGSGAPRPGLGFQGGDNSEMILVPGSVIGLVIGRGGETIKSIQERTGAMVQVIKEIRPDAQGMRDVKLIGQPGPIAAARVAIEEIIASSKEFGGSGVQRGPPQGGYGGGGGGGGGYGGPGIPGMDNPGGGGGGGFRGGPPGGGPMAGPGMVTVSVPVPKDAIGTIIGRGGRCRDSMRTSESGAWVTR